LRVNCLMSFTRVVYLHYTCTSRLLALGTRIKTVRLYSVNMPYLCTSVHQIGIPLEYR
jgi:hypothetical protein